MSRAREEATAVDGTRTMNDRVHLGMATRQCGDTTRQRSLVSGKKTPIRSPVHLAIGSHRAIETVDDLCMNNDFFST
jgi:hypothetical protein